MINNNLVKQLIVWPKNFSFMPCNTCNNYTNDKRCKLPQDYPEGYIASDNTGRRCVMGRGCWHYESNKLL